ncbi:hypothetical protein J6TS1_32540 [Siminovitchia terrae]|uniref:XRE family transcriptional regulator n=1 Tax=Siminovitchia terrae TaxID=1914933 RepID=A0A429X9F3_SIMTE|nr:helix-turn-helix transcriptional regulator [Siminovitchia terrae]RST60057.1 XRE family transcriptional regulator [Siminovitchia terrae]GIN92581.1 hypothetical protein J22TS1_36320 [Siminovitchia terrae]GIN97384.1 hypothetical protein J6TS1_32540 [Siminovitchia terrae]
MIGKKIYNIRRKKGMTLSELAKRSNISKSYLSVIERSINENPSIQVIHKIAAGLDVDIKTIIGTDKEQKQYIENEWIEFVSELKKTGIDKKQIHEYKAVIEFIKWRKENTSNDEM